MINQHFGNTNFYERTSKEQAQEFIDEVIIIFFKSITSISKNKKKEEKTHAMPKLEVERVIRSIVLDARTLVAYGMPKLHKGKGNLLPRGPVTAVVGRPFN